MRTPSLLSGKSVKSQLWNAAKPAKSNGNWSHSATGNYDDFYETKTERIKRQSLITILI